MKRLLTWVSIFFGIIVVAEPQTKPDPIQQVKDEIQKLEIHLKPLLQPLLVSDTHCRIWLSAQFLIRILNIVNQVPDGYMRFTFTCISNWGYLEHKGDGMLGCGWYLELNPKVPPQDRLKATLEFHMPSASWNENGILVLSPYLRFLADANLHWHIWGPPIPGWGCDPRRPGGNGFGGDVGGEAASNSEARFLVSFESNLSDWLTIRGNLDYPSKLYMNFYLSLQGLWPVNVGSIEFPVPTGEIFCVRFPSLLQNRGRLSMGAPPIFEKSYNIFFYPEKMEFGKTGISLKSNIMFFWDMK